MDEWLTVDEVATELRVRRETIRALIRAGQLRAARIGKGYRISREALAEYLKRAEQWAARTVPREE